MTTDDRPVTLLDDSTEFGPYLQVEVGQPMHHDWVRMVIRYGSGPDPNVLQIQTCQTLQTLYLPDDAVRQLVTALSLFVAMREPSPTTGVAS